MPFRKECTLADGRVVWCPEYCVGRDELRPTDELWRTHGFLSFTVMRDGEPLGWLPQWGAGIPTEQVKP